MKVARHEKIIELIHQYDIDTQEELASRLNEAGFKVTQATVSRDIRALKLTKVAGKDGKSRYAIINNESGSLSAKYTRVLEDALLSIDGRTEHYCDQNSIRYGNGGSYSVGCTEMAGDPGMYRR